MENVMELKQARSEEVLHELIAARWSPRAFDSRPVEDWKLRSVLEAARWAPSSRNAQPWRFVVARRDEEPDAWAGLRDTLTGNNPHWASAAPLFILAAAVEEAPGERPNGYAAYDTGQAVMSLTLQATALGLAAHQMGGFDREAARALTGLPDGTRPLVVIALGYRSVPGQLPDEMQAGERAPRQRKPLAAIAVAARWGGEPL